eukprot:12514707-Alexandrium_andersonii.AAC.1
MIGRCPIQSYAHFSMKLEDVDVILADVELQLSSLQDKRADLLQKRRYYAAERARRKARAHSPGARPHVAAGASPLIGPTQRAPLGPPLDTPPPEGVAGRCVGARAISPTQEFVPPGSRGGGGGGRP